MLEIKVREESSKPVNSTLSCRSIFAPASLQPGMTEKIGRHYSLHCPHYSAVGECVKWALLLPKAWTVIVHLRRACEISKKDLQPTTTRPAYSSRGVIHLHCSDSPDVLVFFRLYAPLCYS